MALDRWIALIFLILFLIYGYTAWFTMDALLPPILRNNPVWPSSFPKVLSVLGVLSSLAVLVNLERGELDPTAQDINYRRLHEYQLGQAILLVALMVLYALSLRPAGFLISTFLFLSLGSFILGERRYLLTFAIAAIASIAVWYLVERVLGIFLRPFPVIF